MVRADVPVTSWKTKMSIFVISIIREKQSIEAVRDSVHVAAAYVHR